MAADVYLRIGANGAISAASAHDHDLVMGYAGADVRATIRKPRSLPDHRHYWVCLSAVVDGCNTGFAKAEHLHDAVLFELGYVRPFRLLNGVTLFTRDSTAFDRMDQAQFREFKERAAAVIAERFGVDMFEMERTKWHSKI